MVVSWKNVTARTRRWPATLHYRQKPHRCPQAQDRASDLPPERCRDSAILVDFPTVRGNMVSRKSKSNRSWCGPDGLVGAAHGSQGSGSPLRLLYISLSGNYHPVRPVSYTHLRAHETDSYL